MKEIKLDKLDEKLYLDLTEENLPIYMLVNNNINDFYITLNVKYGSIHTEYKNKFDKGFTKVPNGTAHFLEHMMFYQPDKTNAYEYFNTLGSLANATTTNDLTYYEVYGNKYFKENLNHLLDFVFTPYFIKDNLKNEKNIITEEIKMYQDLKDISMIYKTLECIWNKNKRKYLISGTIDDIKNITINDLEDAYNNFYQPSNMFIIITGNFNPTEASNIIKESLKSKQLTNSTIPSLKEEKESNKVATKYYEEKANLKIPKIKISYKIPLNNFKDFNNEEILYYIDIILRNNFGLASKLYEDLSINNLITTPIDYKVNIWDKYIVITLTIESLYPKQILDIIEDNIKDISISSKEFTRYTKCLIANLISSFDNIELININFQNDIIHYNDIITNKRDIIDSLNIGDLNSILKKLKFNNKSIVIFNK